MQRFGSFITSQDDREKGRGVRLVPIMLITHLSGERTLSQLYKDEHLEYEALQLSKYLVKQLQSQKTSIRIRM